MSSGLKLELRFSDRIGIVADLAALMGSSGFNIVSMEVRKHRNIARVCLEAESDGGVTAGDEIIAFVSSIPGFLNGRRIGTLPREKREKRFQVVLDNVSDGIVAIDSRGRITTINRVAEYILDREGDAVIGKTLKEIAFPDNSVLECLSGKTFINIKKSIITPRGRFQFFATGKPIKDASGRVVGAVEIVKDMKEIRALAQAVSQPVQTTFSDIVGKSPAILEVIAFAQKIAGTDSVVSIRGESGTGKDLFANAIHHESGRPGPFIPINCAALPGSLLESELFGYVGGAFTGAGKNGKPGLFERARGGTVFLDEIGDMPPDAQAKILRLIQERRVRRIGGTEEIAVDTRIITATHTHLEQMVADGGFREDLYYRINVLPIHIPPLRERTDDLPVLADHFLFQLGDRLGKMRQEISGSALDKLRGHRWPGNVRELKNVIERAAILCSDAEIPADGILFSLGIGGRPRKITSTFAPELGDRPLRTLLGEYEKEILVRVLKNARSIRSAAIRLGISHTALMNKMKKYHLKMERKQTSGN